MRSTLGVFEKETPKKAEAIIKCPHGCKWQDLSAPGRLAVGELQSDPLVRLCKTDKGMGIVSDSIEKQRMVLTLHDSASAGTYQ